MKKQFVLDNTAQQLPVPAKRRRSPTCMRRVISKKIPAKKDVIKGVDVLMFKMIIQSARSATVSFKKIDAVKNGFVVSSVHVADVGCAGHESDKETINLRILQHFKLIAVLI